LICASVGFSASGIGSRHAIAKGLEALREHTAEFDDEVRTAHLTASK
jgi:hypothetical protein